MFGMNVHDLFTYILFSKYKRTRNCQNVTRLNWTGPNSTYNIIKPMYNNCYIYRQLSRVNENDVSLVPSWDAFVIEAHNASTKPLLTIFINRFTNHFKRFADILKPFKIY